METRGRKRSIKSIGKQENVKSARTEFETVENKNNKLDIQRDLNNKIKDLTDKRNKTFERKDSGYSSCSDFEDDADVICPCDVNAQCDCSPPDSVDAYVEWSQTSDIPPVRRTRLKSIRNLIHSRSKTTAVFIKHPLATDDPLGDRFGASIETYKKQKDGYYRHVIRQVDVNGVADRMKISEGDEVVLLNDTFVPELDHEAVLKLFQEVPVDSHTRFALVLRRPLSRGTWEWVSTSAILIPELPNEPSVRDLKFSKDTGPQTFCHWYQLKVPGTNLFVIISEGQVRVEVATSENHKKYSICIRVELSFDDKSASYIYNACVFGMHHEERTRNIYLHVEDHGDVGLNERPQWFGYELLGSKMALKFHELNQYIGYQTSDFGQSGQLLLCANRDNALFECCPVAGSYDHTDSESDQMSEPSSLSSSRSSAYSFGNFSQPSNEPLSLEISDASSGSYESWSNSSQGDGGYHRNLRSRRSSRSRPESFEDPVSDTGSECLSYSGSEYLSSETIINSCGTPNTPMANMRLSFCGEDKP